MKIPEVIESLKVEKGGTVFLRMSEGLSASQMEEIKRGFAGAELDCMVVFLPPEVEVSADE